MSSSKSRRKVTVESTTKSSSESSAEKRKPSVFARLGPGAPRRSYEEAEPLEKCRNWMKTGQCLYGSKCRFQHPPRRGSRERSPTSHSHRRVRKRKDRDSEGSAEEDLAEIEDADKERRERKSRSKKEKEGKVKSAIVVTKANLANSENADSDLPLEHDKEELDDFDATLKLMEKRQLIQKQLSMLEAEEVNKDPPEGSTVTKSVTSDILDRDPASATGSSWSGKWDQPRKSSTALPLSSEDSPSKRKKEKKKKKRTKGPRTPSPDEERREKRFVEKEAATQLEVIPSRKKPKHSVTDQPQKSRSSGAVSRSPSKSSSGSRSPPRRTHSAGHRRKGTDDRSASRKEKYEPASLAPAKLPPSSKSGRKRQVSPPEAVIESGLTRPEKKHRRFVETPRDERITKMKRTPPPRDNASREHVTSQQRHLQGEFVSSKSRTTAASPPPGKSRWHQSSRHNKTPTKQSRKSQKHYVEEEDDDDDSSSDDDDDDSSSSGSSSSSSSDSSSSSSSDDSADSVEEEVVVSKSRRHTKSWKSYPTMPDTRVVKKKRSTTKERYSPVEDSRRSKQRPRGGANERMSKGRRSSPPLLPPLEERQRHWNREHMASSVDEGRSRGRKHGPRSRKAASPQPIDTMPRSRQKSPSSPYDHPRERQHGRDDYDRHYPEKSRERGEKWDPVDRRTDSPISRSRGENRDRYAHPPEYERRPSPPPSELQRRPLSPQEYVKLPKSGRSLSPGDRMTRQYKDDRGRPIRERDRLPREESPPHLPHQPVDRYGKRYRAMYDDHDSYRPALLPTPKDRYRYEQEQGPLHPPIPPQLPPPEMLDRYGREPYLLSLPPGGRDLVMDRRDDPLGRRDFPGYHDDGRGARGRGSPDRHPFPSPGYPVERMLEPALEPMYGDLKERDRPMLGWARERSPLMDKRGDKYRRDDPLPRGGELPPGKGRPSRRQQWEERPDTRDRQRGLESPDSRDMALKKRMPEVEGRGSPVRRRGDLSPVESRHSGAGGRGVDWDRRREDWDRGRDRGGRRRRGKREEDREQGVVGGGREKWPGERMEGDNTARERDWQRDKMPKPAVEGPPSRGQSPESRDLREGSTGSSRRRHRSSSKETLPSGERKKKRPKLEVDAEWEKGNKSRRSRHGSPPPRGAARSGTGGGADDDQDDWSEEEKPPDGTTQSQKGKKDTPLGEVPVPRPSEDPVRHSPSRSSLGSRHSQRSHDRLHGNDRPHGDYDSDGDGGRARIPPPRERGERGRQQDWEHDLERPHPEGALMGAERGRLGHSRDRPGREERGREDWDREGGHWQRPRHRDRHERPETPSRETERPPSGELANHSVDVVAPQLTPSGGDARLSDAASIGDIGYENISSGDDIDDIIGDMKDDDQDEHTGRKSGVVDTLCIDWSGLVQQQPIRAAMRSTSALKRFQPASVFSRLGVSKALAGPALLEKVKRICECQLDTGSDASDVTKAKDVTDEKNVTDTKDITVKEEKETSDNVETATSETTTNENPDVDGEKKVDASKRVKQSFELLHDIAAFHASSVVKKRERANLLWSIGPHRRALCARRDLEIRRQLCKLGKDSEGLGMFTLSQGVDQDLYRLSLQLFTQVRAGGATAADAKLKPIVDEAKMVAT